MQKDLENQGIAVEQSYLGRENDYPDEKPKASAAVRAQHIQYFSSETPTILICSHRSRDPRCGALGPLLNEEFSKYISAQIDRSKVEKLPDGQIKLHLTRKKKFVIHNALRGIRVASISHIGGHAWAGNVIIYLPSFFRLENGERSPLAGKGVWYGRVEPKHVEGIVEQTIRQGTVIEELLRGVHYQPSKKP